MKKEMKEEIPEEDKKALVDEAIKAASSCLLLPFYLLELKNGMEGTIINGEDVFYLSFKKECAEEKKEEQNELLFLVAEIAEKQLYYNKIGTGVEYKPNYEERQDKKLFDQSKDKWLFDSLGFIRELKKRGYQLINTKESLQPDEKETITLQSKINSETWHEEQDQE